MERLLCRKLVEREVQRVIDAGRIISCADFTLDQTETFLYLSKCPTFGSGTCQVLKKLHIPNIAGFTDWLLLFLCNWREGCKMGSNQGEILDRVPAINSHLMFSGTLLRPWNLLQGIRICSLILPEESMLAV